MTGLGDAAIPGWLSDLMRDLAGHHAEVTAVFTQRHAEIHGVIGNDAPVVGDRAMLIGACFCQDCGDEAAALFDPGIVPHAVADSITTFARMPVDRPIAAMRQTRDI